MKKKPAEVDVTLPGTVAIVRSNPDHAAAWSGSIALPPVPGSEKFFYLEPGDVMLVIADTRHLGRSLEKSEVMCLIVTNRPGLSNPGPYWLEPGSWERLAQKGYVELVLASPARRTLRREERRAHDHGD